MTDPVLHELACRAGALVLGEPGSTQQYMLSLAELRCFIDLASVPPCPVPLPAPPETKNNASLV